jgi:hypothetical protein
MMDGSEKYISAVIIGHGGLVTQLNENSNTHELVRCDFSKSIKLNICTFAAPSEECSYAPETLLYLKDTLIEKSQEYDFSKESFKILVVDSQLKASGFQYSSPEWSRFFSKKPRFTENWISGNSCFEKEYLNVEEDPLLEGKCGFYILKNNIGLPVGEFMEFDDGFNTLCSFISLFIDQFNVTNINILDCACSVLINREEKKLSERGIRRMTRDVVKEIEHEKVKKIKTDKKYGGKKINITKKMKKTKKRGKTKNKKRRKTKKYYKK